MNANNHKWYGITILMLVTSLTAAGCQATATEQEPEREIVVEKEVNCPMVNFTPSSGIPVDDPELGSVERGVIYRWRFTCEEPYLKGRVIGLVDSYSPDGLSLRNWGYYEIVTDEGGIWEGPCEQVTSTECTFEGQGLYKDLQMSLVYWIESGNCTFTVFRLIETEE